MKLAEALLIRSDMQKNLLKLKDVFVVMLKFKKAIRQMKIQVI